MRSPVPSLSVLLGALAVLLLFLGAWLLLPRQVVTDSRAAVRVLLIDASASATRVRPGWLPWVRRVLREEAELASALGELLVPLSFAGDVAGSGELLKPRDLETMLAGGPRGVAPYDPRRGAGSELESRVLPALELARESLGGAVGDSLAGTLVLVGWSGASDVDPRAALRRLAGAGVSLEERALPPTELGDLELRAAEVPREVEANAPWLVVCQLGWRPGSRGGPEPERAYLEVTVSGEPDGARFEVPLDLPPGGGVWRAPIDLGPASFGRNELTLRVRLEPGPDPIPENDLQRAASTARGQLVIGVLATADRLEAARSWLAPSGRSSLAGIQFVFATPASLLELSGEVDAWVSFDLAPEDLPRGPFEAFLEAGGGWLVTCGWRFLENWIAVEGQSSAVAENALRRFLPFEPAPLEQGPRDVVLFVDGSGSMEGRPFETVRTACLDLVAAAMPTDEVSLSFFTTQPDNGTRIKRRTRDAISDEQTAEESAKELLRLRVPSGQTHILASLEALADRLAPSERDALVLLLSDGLEREGMPDPAGRAARLRERLVLDDVELRVIAVGEEADLDFLRTLTRPGEEVLEPRSLDELRDVFRREISGVQWREGMLDIVAPAPAPGSIAATIFPAGMPSLAPLGRLVRNVAVPGAEVVWSSDRGEPVLALHRTGRGRVAQFGSLPAAGWAPAWSERFGIGEPAAFAGLLRWLARGGGRRDDELRAAVQGEELVVRGLDSGWPGELEGRLDGAGPGGERVEVTLLPPPGDGGFDPLGRRSARISRDLARTLRTRTFALELEGRGGVRYVPVEAGGEPEFTAEIPWRGLEEEEVPPTLKRSVGRSRARRGGAAAVLSGLLLAFFSACLARGGQGIPTSGR